MERTNLDTAIYVICIQHFGYFQGIAGLLCGDIRLSDRVDCANSSLNEAFCLNQGCCYDSSMEPGVPKCFYKADQRKMSISTDSSGVKHIEYDSKQYIVTANTFSHDQLEYQCSLHGPEYKPAYINYMQEYDMLRLGLRLFFGVRGLTQWLEAWVGGTTSGHVDNYTRSTIPSNSCPALIYWTYNGFNTGKTVVLYPKSCSNIYIHGICEKHTITMIQGVPALYGPFTTDIDGCYSFSTMSHTSGMRYRQSITFNNVQSNFVLEMPVKEKSTCDGIFFGLDEQSEACSTIYLRKSTCEVLETPPNEASCYVRCWCVDLTCDGTVIVTMFREEPGWSLCPLDVS